MITVVRVFSIILLLITLVWLVHEPGYVSVITFVTALVGVFTSFLYKKDKKESTTSLNVQANSIGIQAGGDASNININQKNESK